MEETTTTETVQTKETVKTKKKFKPVRLISIFLVTGLIIVSFAFLLNFVNTTSSIISKDKSSNCKGEYCMQIETIYMDGWTYWKAAEFLPAFFSMTTSGFDNGAKTLVTCPVKSTTNDLGSKLGFFFNNPDIQKCVVTLR